MTAREKTVDGNDALGASAEHMFSDRREPVDASAALLKLKEGNLAYLEAKRNIGDISPEMRADTCENGQHPFAVVLTCADSRVVPEHMFMAGIGELFVIRVAGNVMGDTQMASVLYAVSHLGAKLVMVLGHTHCGAIEAAMSGEAHGCVRAVTNTIAAAIGDTTDDYAACILNVRTAVNTLCKNGEMAEQMAGDDVDVVGGVYHIDTGEVDFV